MYAHIHVYADIYMYTYVLIFLVLLFVIIVIISAFDLILQIVEKGIYKIKKLSAFPLPHHPTSWRGTLPSFLILVSIN